MFDLEKSISNWRKQMLAAGIKSPVPLEELEIHLREEIERQTKSGLNEQSVFKIAVEKIGHPGKLKTEFKKVPLPPEIQLVRLAGIACGVVGTLFLLWTVSVGFFIREANWGSRAFGIFSVALIILIWRYAGRFLPSIRHPKVRATSGLASCVVGVGGTLVFISRILPGLFVAPVGTDFSLNRLLVSFVIVWAAMAILGVFAYRLNEASGQKEG